VRGLHETRREDCHWLLLRLAGAVEDDLVTRCRAWLGDGRVGDVGRALAFAVLGHHLRITSGDRDLLSELIGADLSGATVVDTDPLPGYAFAADPRHAGLTASADTPPPVPGTAGPEDCLDWTAVWAVGRQRQVRALWRAWRCDARARQRVHVLETDAGAPVADIAAAVQRDLTSPAQPSPQVEVYPVRQGDRRLPSYQRLARSYGALLWAREPAHAVHLAKTYAGEPETPALSGAEVFRLLGYLRGGEPVLLTPIRARDVLDPAAPARVPMNHRTDGTWVWSEAVVYYLERYRMAPDPALLGHVRARGFRRPEVDGAALHRVLAALRDPQWSRATGPAPAWIEA
jgi:hypothetical protein